MYELTVERGFSAAHHLRDYQGPCSRMHGHNYRVEITVAGPETGADGMLMDFGEIKQVCDEVLGELDHRCLNDLPAFASENVTSENLARYILQAMASRLQNEAVAVARVRLWETEGSSVTYWEN